MKQVTIKTIPHKKQRYETPGDYFNIGKKETMFHISDLKNNDYEFLVAIHEIIEWYFTERAGIKEKDIMKFDKEFEAKRKTGNTDEPGNDPSAPYYEQHQFATFIEKQIAKELGINWREYEHAFDKFIK